MEFSLKVMHLTPPLLHYHVYSDAGSPRSRRCRAEISFSLIHHLLTPPSVVVTLDYINTRRPRDPADDDSFKREFILTPDSPMMPIARATSRPEGRGKAARNNAFFNSPIISRKHAELFIEPASKVPVSHFCGNPSLIDLAKDHIYIKDLGSMHGTALNGNSIKEGKHLIRNGDLVTLGQIVVQGNSESFVSCET